MRCPRLPTFMVASSFGSSMPRAGGNRVRFRVTITVVIAMTDPVPKPSAAVALPLFAKERPLASEVGEWIDAAKPLLPADQRALVDGFEPRALIAYRLATLPGALVESTSTGITAAQVAAREASRLAIQDANATKGAQKSAHESEIKEALFNSLQTALKPKAPLLLDKLERDHKQTGAYVGRFDGVAASRFSRAPASAHICS